jgi:MFS family permease
MFGHSGGARLKESRWLQFLARHERGVEFAMFGVVCLGIGTLLFIVWAVLLIAALAARDWQAFTEFLLGVLFVPLIPLIGIRWLRQRREQPDSN